MYYIFLYINKLRKNYTNPLYIPGKWVAFGRRFFSANKENDIYTAKREIKTTDC